MLISVLATIGIARTDPIPPALEEPSSSSEADQRHLQGECDIDQVSPLQPLLANRLGRLCADWHRDLGHRYISPIAQLWSDKPAAEIVSLPFHQSSALYP